jgi:hypothetical protein
MAKAFEELEGGACKRAEGDVLILASGQSIGDSVEATRPILDGQVVAKYLAHPLVLQNHGQALVDHELEGIMICADDEVMAPKVQPPMVNHLDQSDQLLFIHGEFQMASHK